MKLILHPFICCCVLFLVGCIPPRVDNRGHVDAFDNVSNVAPGTTSREQVRELLGSPSVTNNFGDEIWYYIAKRKEAVAFLEADITEQQVTQIIFDSAGIVTSVKRYDGHDAQQVALADEVTPTEGQELGFFEQILGNVGRFNGGGSAADNPIGGSRTGGPPIGR